MNLIIMSLLPIFLTNNLKLKIMPKLDGTGPEGEGSQTGRKLGKCTTKTDAEKSQNLGKGMGKKRKSGEGAGKGKRTKT